MKFLKEIFEENGTASFARVACGIIIIFILFWSTYGLIFLADHKIPEMGGAITLVTLLYGAARAGAVGEALAQK